MSKLQRYLNKLIISAAVILLFGLTGLAKAAYLNLSSYFVWPGQPVTVNGAGFVPNQKISVSTGSQGLEAATDRAGKLIPITFTTKNTDANSQIKVATSGLTKDAVLTVKGFYPVVQPSSYFILPGNSLSFSGKGFQPNETVEIISAKNTNLIKVDGEGAINSGTFTVGYNSGAQTYNFIGQDSRAKSSVKIFVAELKPYLLLSNYYATGGSAFEIRGFQFGSNENVDLSFSNTKLGKVLTDSNGSFVWKGVVPVQSGKFFVIRATAANTGRNANADFTLNTIGN